MTNRIASALLVVAFLVVSSIAAQEKPAALPAELTLDQIVQKHVEALGGLEKLKAINTLSAYGHAVTSGGQGESPMLMQMKRPSSMRIEMTIQGKKIIQAFDGTTAWMINPLMGSTVPRKAADADAQEMRDSADIDFSSLVDYKSKGNKVELLGMEEVESAPSYKLKVTKRNGRVEYDYLDAKTFLQVKSTTKRKQGGSEIEIDAYPTNYKPVNGVLFPYLVDQRSGGKSMVQLVIVKVDVNEPIADSAFQFPAAKEELDKGPGTGK